MDSSQIEFVEHVDCCDTCKYGRPYLSLGGNNNIECAKFHIDVYTNSLCKYYEDA